MARTVLFWETTMIDHDLPAGCHAAAVAEALEDAQKRPMNRPRTSQAGDPEGEFGGQQQQSVSGPDIGIQTLYG